jgi:hypothetical protein
MRSALIFLLGVGVIWAVFAIWLFLSVGGVAGEIESFTYALFYWAAMLAGPVALMIGSGLLLGGLPSTLSYLLVAVGCLALTVFALYNSVVGMRRGPLEAPPVYWFYAVLLAVMLIADLAGFAVLRNRGSAPTEQR